MRLGFHLPLAGGLPHCLYQARLRRCTALQLFTSAPVQWAPRPLDVTAGQAFREARLAADIEPLFIHAPYLLNLASSDRALRAKSITRLTTDLGFAEVWGARGVVLHLGSGGPETRLATAITRVAAGLRAALDQSPGTTEVLLENSAGQGRIVGGTPEELGEVLGQAGSERIGLCLDTAHAFAAGFAVHEPEGLRELLARLTAACGPERLRLIHANDSLGAFGSHRDRHWHIGQGEIGRRGWRTIMGCPDLWGLPFIMETPKDEKQALADDRRNMQALRRAIPAEARPPLPRLPRTD